MNQYSAETSSTVGFSVVPIGNIRIVQILETEMDEFERVASAGQQALGFFQFSLGALLSAAVAWATTAAPSPTQQAVYAAVCVPLALASVWFGLQWRRESKLRAAVFARIRSRFVPQGIP